MKRFYEWAINIMDWCDCSPVGTHGYDFTYVTFKENFGPWKKGDKAEMICFEFLDMTVGEFATDTDPDAREGETVFKKSCEFVLTPAPAPKENTLCQNPAHLSESSSKKPEKAEA